MGKTIDVETFKQNLLNKIDNDNKILFNYIDSGNFVNAFEWIVRTNKDLIEALDEQTEQLNKTTIKIDDIVAEKNADLVNEHEELKKKYELLLSHVDFLGSIFGGRHGI